MKWLKINLEETIKTGKRSAYQALGEKGMFVIYKDKTTRGRWAGYYKSPTKLFRLQSSNKLQAVKDMCEDNYYWESPIKSIQPFIPVRTAAQQTNCVEEWWHK